MSPSRWNGRLPWASYSHLSTPPLGIVRRMRRLRKERGLTQVELSDKLSTTQVIVSNYESGKLRPHPDMLVRLAKALAVSTDELLGVKAREETGVVSRRVLRRLQAIDGLPKRDKDALLRIIDAFLEAKKAG